MKKNVYFADLVLCNRVLIPCASLDLASDGVVSSAAVFWDVTKISPPQRGSIAYVTSQKTAAKETTDEEVAFGSLFLENEEQIGKDQLRNDAFHVKASHSAKN